jgi:hypothetical protein
MICPITQEEIITPMALPCGHVFEQDSINSWLENHTICPICRNNVNNDTSCSSDNVARFTQDEMYRGLRQHTSGIITAGFEPPATTATTATAGSPLYVPFKDGLRTFIVRDIRYFHIRYDNHQCDSRFDGLLNVLQYDLRSFMTSNSNRPSYRGVYRNIIMKLVKNIEEAFITQNRNMYQILGYFQNNLNISMGTSDDDIDENLYLFSIELFEEIYQAIKQKIEIFNMTSNNQINNNAVPTRDSCDFLRIDRNNSKRKLGELLGSFK